MIKLRGRDGALLMARGRRRGWERFVEFHLLSPHLELNKAATEGRLRRGVA